ncbi:transmembrane protease serine 11D-like [Achroia grisella]|uniref:transmembrane protease serine 11D-like n=1 Tax=Achroia grisella TaxID=688607 RepID=UPI0027D33689|nr:transmembrane protease serine 11D-like [Achroia grisella]
MAVIYFKTVLFGFLVFLLNINCMSINGPALTRYDPCGLAVVYFDKITDKLWRGVVNFNLYRLSEAYIEIHFEKKAKLYGASQNTSISVINNWHGFILKPNGETPIPYSFFVSIDNSEANTTDVPIVTQFKINNVTLCNDAVKASQTIESLNVTKTSSKYKQICGRRSLDHTELVSVRTESRAGDWPWHVAIFLWNPNMTNEEYYCGGNIISRTAIVTAGHCVRKDGVTVDASRIVIVAGVSNRRDSKQVGRQIVMAKEVILHPSYTDTLATADLAVIKVNSFQYTEYVQPICLWGPVYDKAMLFGKAAVIVGFGQTEDNKPSDILRSTYTLIQNDTTCVTFSANVYENLLNEFTFCAGYGANSTVNPRNGDSGGGLVIPVLQPDHKVSWFLRGVLSKCGVSPGSKDCDPHYYMVYTDVGPHYGWIYHHSGLKFQSHIIESTS